MIFAAGDGKESEPSTSSSPPMQWSQPFRHFEFPEILTATENFDVSLVIGRGGFGKVYKGSIINGASLVIAAIKRLDSMSNQGATEFWAEVEMLSVLHHRNIVSLIGYCIHEQEKILVYEFMPNGTLDDHLHKRRSPLSWLQRLNICIGAGRGLHYLHNDVGVDSGVIHRDFQSSNILLHDNWEAKISDFGLSKTCPTNQPSTHLNTLIKGTFGYLDPNYFKTGKLTRKSGVYAFGVVLLETLCRKPAVENLCDGECRNLATWAQDSIKEGSLKHIVDSDIRSEISQKCLKEFVKIAQRCLHDNPEQRPTMAGVLVTLEYLLTLQEKFNIQAAGTRTIFGRMVDMLPFSFNGENYVQGDSKLSGNSKGNNRIASSTVRDMFPEIKDVPADSLSPSPSLKEYRFDDLKTATRDFSQDLLLGEGGFGEVFLGWVDKKTLAPSEYGDGIAVAVKRLRQESNQGYAEWLAEVNILGQLAHPNIIRLLGYCKDDLEHLLVYEYMPNKSFYHILFKDAPDSEPLSWGRRLLIMIGVARGLTYMHSTNLIHRGVKSIDILLDEDFNAKLGDFGSVKYGPGTGKTHITTLVKGSSGYVDPEYYKTGHLTTKTDIYGFGMVVLESITGRPAIFFSNDEPQTLVKWVSDKYISNGRQLKKIMDPCLEDKYPLKGAFKCFALAARCLADNPKDRPSSKEVQKTLEHIYALYK